jgi:succinoglycan biosynthesis transport protein ExoP
MATIPAPMGMSGPARPAGGPSASGPLPVVSIDPLKLLLKYKWILAAAFIGGAVIGGGAHFAWLLTWPYFRSNVLFQTYVQVAELDKLTGYGQVDDAELDKYMQTQTKLMTSAGVLQRVAEDPRLPQEAPKWAKWRMEDGKFNTVEALIDLQDTVSARVVPQTRLIDLSFTYRDKAEAKAIVGLVRDAYQRTIADSTRAANRQQRDALTKTIAEMQSQIEAVQGQRERLMKDVSYTNLNRLSNETSEALRVVNQERVKVGLDIESFTVRLKELEAELQNPAGPSYTDQLRDVVENDTLMLSLANQINDLESGLRGLKLRFTDEHRDVKQYKAMIDAAKSQQESERQRLLRQKFDAEVDSVRKAVSQLQAQDSDLAAKQERYSVRLAELTQAEATIDDMDEQAKRLIQERTVMQSSLQTVNALESLDTNKRILVLQEERLPDEVTFPKLKIMVPAGAIVVFGLVLGVLVLREMVDQRVKGPADVAIIPKGPHRRHRARRARGPGGAGRARDVLHQARAGRDGRELPPGAGRGPQAAGARGAPGASGGGRAARVGLDHGGVEPGAGAGGVGTSGCCSSTRTCGAPRCTRCTSSRKGRAWARCSRARTRSRAWCTRSTPSRACM